MTRESSDTASTSMGKDKDEQKLPPTASQDKEDKEKGKAVRWSEEVENVNEAATILEEPPSSFDVARSPGHSADARVESPTTTDSMEQSARVMLQDDWELTWPIWHMLPWQERKELAQRHGYHTIGAFEEYMSLQKALTGEEVAMGSHRTDASNSGSASLPYSNELAYDKDMDQKLAAKDNQKTEGNEDDSDSDSEDDKYTTFTTTSNSIETNSETEDASESDSLLLTFPDEILHRIFSYLPVTLYGTKLAYVSRHPHWTRVATSETAMKHICERVYLQQSKKKQLRLHRFHHSYKFMLYARPRVQAGGGVYVLRFSRVKHIQRDMFTVRTIFAFLSL